MQNRIIQTRNKILSQVMTLDDSQPDLGMAVITFLQMQTQLLNLSYLPLNQYGYLRIVSGICRPQTIIEMGDTSLISITIMLIYLLYMIIPIKGKKIVSLIGLVLETPIFNFFIETAFYPQFYLLLFLLIVAQLARTIILDGQLDIEIINFQYIKQSWINRAIKLLRFVQIFNFQDFQLLISTTMALLYIWRNFLQQQPLQYIKTSMQINFLTLYYSFLSALNFDQQFSTEIIIIPFILKISSLIVQRMAYKSSYNLDDIFTLIIQQQNVILKKKHQLNHLTIDQAIFKLVSKDPLRRKNLNFEDAVIYASSLMKFDKKFEALKYILILEEIKQPIITSLKLKRLHTKCLKQIFRKMEQKQILVGKMVKDLMYTEHQNYSLHHQIVNIIIRKINFLKLLDQQKIQKSQILEMNSQIILLRDNLYRYNNRAQSRKSKSILTFYQCEILNDLIEPQLRHTQQRSSGFENLLRGQFLTDKMIYLLTEYQEDLIIKRHSNNIQEILMKSDIVNEKVDLFLPIAVSNVHKQLVEQMFDDGHSKFMRNLSDNILKLPNGFLITIEFALDVLFVKDTLQFVVFIQQSINQPMKMAADQNFIINHISDNICLYIKPFQLIGRSLLEFIPNFEISIENEDYLVFDQVEILKYKYQAQLSVYTRKLQQRPVYFIIQIISIRSIINQEESSFIIHQQNESLDEDVEIINPNIFSDYQDPPIQTQRITSPKSTFIVPFIQNQEQNFFVTKQKLDSDLTSNHQHKKSKQKLVYKKTNASSKHNISKSQYFKKYELVLKSGLLQGFSKFHKILLALLLLLLATQQSVQISQFIIVNNSMNSIISDIEMLQIKNLVFQPLQSFLLTRWNILSYNNLYQQGLINQTYLQSLLIFPYSNLVLGYDDLTFNIKNLQNYKGLSIYYYETLINISLYSNTNQGQVYLFPLRESLDILLNYQYIIKKRYQIEGSVILDSPYVYFTYKNLINLNNIFTDINNQVYKNSIYKSQILIDSVQTLLIATLVVLATFTLIISYYYIKIEKKTFLYQSLLYSVDRDQITQEISRLQLLHRCITQNNNKIFTYQFNIDTLEQQFSNISSSYQKNKKKQINFKKSYMNSILIGLLITYFFIIGYSIFCNYYANQFLNQYPSTAKLYMAYSIIGTDVPTIYAMREVLYNRNLFPFYQGEDQQQILDLIIESLNTLKDFTNMQYSKDQLIMSDAFYDYLINLNAQNLCIYFKEDLSDLSYSLCRSSMDGSINRGLRELLVYVQNNIQNEMIINKFQLRIQKFQIGELEGAFIISYLIKIINKNFNLDIFQQTTNQNDLAQTLMLVFAILLFAFQIYFILSIKFIHQREFYLQQRIVYLIPRNVLLFDDTFERNLRSLFTQEIFEKQ